MSNEDIDLSALAPTEAQKAHSRHLRGTLAESLEDQITGAIREEDLHLLKHHGTYQQDDRDLRNERRKQFLEPDYSFMIRARMPGGVTTPEQWLAMDEIAQAYGNNSLRLTTRQTFQFHGVVKDHLKPTFQQMYAVLVDAIAACGDVNRNVMCNPNPVDSRVHEEVYQYAVDISEHLLPNTNAYAEIWLDGEKVDVSKEEEPIYGERYLPRKYKTVIAVPPYNDVDIFAHDMGFIAIIEDGELKGFNVTVGGGLGMTHGDPETFARLADVIGFCKKEDVLKVSEEILKIQRDFGDRVNRRFARFKYTIAKHGVEWFKEELGKRLGAPLEAERPYEFISNSDRYGWIEGYDGRWHLNLFIQNGRIKDGDGLQLMTGLREVAKIHKGDFRITANQNIIIANIAPEDRPEIEALVAKYDMQTGEHISAVRLNSMACVALPTCSLAMAESERYLPDLVTDIEQLQAKHNMSEQDITVRMQGCPNGCGRAVLAEIGFIGKGPGKYNMYLGAGRWGQRFSALYRENIDEREILAELDRLFARYVEERTADEPFGDFLVRVEVVEANTAPEAFHNEKALIPAIEL